MDIVSLTQANMLFSQQFIKKFSFFERSHTPSEPPEQSGLHSFQFHKRLLYKNLAYFDADAISIRVD